MEQKIAIRQLNELKRNTKLNGNGHLRLAAEWDEKWKILIATILSAQTRDETTIKISEILFKKYNTLKKFAKADVKDIKKIIRPINFHKTKAKNVSKTSKIISKTGIPENIEGLLELPGVGRKVANVYLVEAYKAPAIGVDTHVAFISRYLGWTKNKNPHKIEKDLERLFPKRLWNSINYILVRFGRTHNRKNQMKILDEIKEQ